ncbi:MAG: hypothetical protein QM534_06775 [Sediminibacterium sp.]|nr:hypothetical protein [Sediminibacterium sp.]
MANKFELPEDTALAKKVIDHESKKHELKVRAGWLGQFFGVTKHVGLYIVGLICIILILTATIYTFFPDNSKPTSLSSEKLWTIVLPVITTLIGYIFGVSQKNEKSNEE